MKKSTNRLIMRFPGISVNESFARSAAAAFVAQLDPTVDEISDIKTAVSEAVTNAIVHGYRDAVGEILLCVEILEDNIVEITVKDRGCGIENVEKAREPMFTTGGSERSGLGFTIMESFMDHLAVRSKIGSGTTVKMRKAVSTKCRK